MARALYGIYALLLVAGIAFVGWGTNSKNSFLTAIGGTMMGTSFSGVVSTFRQTWDYQSSQVLQKAGYQSIQEILTKSLKEDFSSSPDSIKEYKDKEFHYYHLTKVDGHDEWRQEDLIFNQNPAPGKLIALGTNPNRLGGGSIEYQCEAIVRGENLIMLRSPIVNESKKLAREYTVAVFPKMNNPHLAPHYAGIAFKTSFDDQHITVPCLLSEVEVGLKEVEVIWDKAFVYTSQLSEVLANSLKTASTQANP